MGFLTHNVNRTKTIYKYYVALKRRIITQKVYLYVFFDYSITITSLNFFRNYPNSLKRLVVSCG